MINIKNFSDFLLENDIPNLTIDIDDILSVLNYSVDVFRVFEINKDKIKPSDEIEKLYTDSNFKNIIESKNMKIGKSQNTKYSETLLDEKYILKFFFIYDINASELEEPNYVILQYFDKVSNKRSDIIGYSNDNKTNNFYKLLTDNTIELINGDKTYIYQTTNGGNNWEMKNVQMEEEDIKATLDNDELLKMINNKNLKLKK